MQLTPLKANEGLVVSFSEYLIRIGVMRDMPRLFRENADMGWDDIVARCQSGDSG